MITITKDSELMTNYVTANPVPAGEEFGAFTDKDHQPAALSLSEDSFLYLIIADKGKTARVDFGKSSGIVGEGVKVQAFAVQQASDGSLDICIAVKASSTESDFFMLHDIQLNEILQPIPKEKIIRGRFPTVDHMYMGNKSTDTVRSMPLVMVAFTRPDRLTRTEDLNFVEVKGDTATLNGSWKLKANPKRITAVTLGTCPLGDGAFILYEGQSGTTYLLFQTFTGDSPFAVQPPCPDGAIALSTFWDTKNEWSMLLVGGTKITYFTPKNYCSAKGEEAEIHTLDNISGLKDLHCSQTGENLRFWYTTLDDAVHYYTTVTSSLSKGTVIPLLAEKQGGRVSGLLSLKEKNEHSDLLVSSLLVVDEYGNLSLLQQDSSSQAWQQYSFWYASEKNVMEVKGYMLRFHTTVVNDPANTKASDDGADLIPGCWLCVKSSGVVRCFINGKHSTLAPTAQWYQTDSKGVLNILLQTEDATCHQFAAERFRPVQTTKGPKTDGEKILSDPLIDPSRKVVNKLKDIKTKNDLLGLRKQDGSPVVGPHVPDDDVKTAVKAFQDLFDRAKELHQSQKQQQILYMAAVKESMSDQYLGGDIIPFGLLNDVGDGLIGLWHWAEGKGEEVWKWGCDGAGKFLKFVVHIGEQVFKIALTTVTSVVKGIVWVFKKIGASIEDVIHILGFVFGWSDILDTTDSVAAGFNAALDHGQSLLDSKPVEIKKWLEKLRTTLKTQLPKLQGNDYTGIPSKTSGSIGMVPIADKEADQPRDDDLKAGVAYNWSAYYVSYGGGTTNAVLHDDSLTSMSNSEDKLLGLWDGVVGELQEITDTVTKVAKDFVEFFVPGDYDVGKLISKVGTDLIDGLIDSLEKLAEMLFQALSSGIGIAKDVGNKIIEIPVITWLWKNVIAKGRPLTLLNFCALLIAIPTTVLYKIKKKRAPPKLSGRLNKDTFAQHVTGQGDPSLSADITSFGLAASSGVQMVAEEISTIGLLVDGTFEGSGLETIPVGPISSLMNVVDSAALTFECVDGFLNWPVISQQTTEAETNDFDLKKFVKYSGWGLSLVKGGSAVVVKVIAKAKKAERPVVKRWKGTVGAVISVPTLCLALTKGIEDASDKEKEAGLIANEFLEGVLKFGKQWGTSVAQWNDEIENELMYAGLAVKQVCAFAIYGLKIADFVETQT